MELIQLRYFFAVCEKLHFTRAAEELHISQSSLSQHIQKLESELGVTLFDRSNRKIQLTQAGEILRYYAEKILNHVEEAEKALRVFSRSLQGRVRLGSLPILPELRLPQLLARFKEQFPGVQLEITEAGSETLVKMLLENRLDLAIITVLPGLPEELTVHSLVSEELVAVVNRTHRLSQHRRIDLAELAEDPFIFMKPGFGIRHLSLRACRSAGFEPKIILETSQVSTLRELVRAGLGVTLMTSMVADIDNDPDLRAIQLRDPVHRVTALACRRDETLSEAERRLRDLILGSAGTFLGGRQVGAEHLLDRPTDEEISNTQNCRLHLSPRSPLP